MELWRLRFPPSFCISQAVIVYKNWFLTYVPGKIKVKTKALAVKYMSFALSSHLEDHHVSCVV